MCSAFLGRTANLMRLQLDHSLYLRPSSLGEGEKRATAYGRPCSMRSELPY
ncbi:hypothetical protein LIA77_02601 [Sarocladium implicatum]|nr:hypothetical protein LIA77_02601 [Sarocladium implicatum]